MDFHYVEEVKKKVDYFEGIDNDRTEIYYETYVTYTVNGKEYEDIIINDVRSDKHTNDVGSYITLYCMESYPTLVKSEINHDDVDLILRGIGIGLIVCGMTLAGGVIIANVVDKYKKKKAIEEMKSEV